MIWRKLPATALVQDPALQLAWNQLNAQRGGLSFMQAHAVATAVAVFGSGQEQLLVAEQAGQPAGQAQAMLLLVRRSAMQWQTFQPSQMPLGLWVAARGVPLQALCRSLLRGPLGLCMVLSISQVDPLLAEREADTPDTWHADYIQTAWLTLAGDFDTYWAARGKNLRQNMRKQRNRLATDGVSTTMRVWREPGDMAGAIARYGALESAGWKSAEGTAIHPDNAQGRFYTRLLEQAAQQGEAVVFEYLFGDKPAAMNLCLLRGGVLSVLKTTYDESIPKTLSPAFLLREDELKHLFASGEVQRIEYFGRRMDWHTKLTDEVRSLYHLTAYRLPLVKQLAERRRRAADHAAEAAAPATAAAPAPDAEA